MKTFREFILECELIEGKVEWDNPKRPLQSGLTPREKNRAVRKRLGVEDPDKSSFFKGGPSERDYERYGKLKAAHDTEKDKKGSKEKLHKFKTTSSMLGKITTGRVRRLTGSHIKAQEARYTEKKNGISVEKLKKRYGDYADLKRLKEPKENE